MVYYIRKVQIFHVLHKKGDQKTNLRFDFLFTNLSQHFGSHLVVFALKFFIYQNGVRGDSKSFVS